MPLTPNFTATQSLGVPTNIDLEDTSTGSDIAVTQRRVYIQLANGNYLVEAGVTTDYNVWSYSDSTISLDVLTEDSAVLITVQWLNVSNAVLYTKSAQYGFTLYNETFDYTLTQMLSGNPLLINDNGFWQKKSTFREKIDSGNNAVEFASDIFAAQQCYNSATEMRLDAATIFNQNS